MKRNQHINVPQGDTRRVEVSITDVSDENADGPTHLLGKTVRWQLKPHPESDTPVIEYTTDDAKLNIEGDPSEGNVSLKLDSTETSGEFDNYRHEFLVEEVTDGETDQWTTTRGLLKIE